MATRLSLEIIVDDKGTATVRQFGKESEKAMKATADTVGQAWKELGKKSDAMFNEQRSAAQKAYDTIKNSATSTAQDIVKAEEAKNAKIAALNNEQIGKSKTIIDQLKSHWIAASAAIVAAWVAVNKAVSYMDMGAQALQVESSFKIMAEAAGVSANSMIESMERATRHTIDSSDLMQKAVKLMTMGYDPAQIERFSNVVVTASQIAGQTVGETYETLADAIATKMPRALVRMGAVTREQMKVVNAAVAAGADEMSLYELAMANLELKTLQLKGTQDAETIAMQQFHATVKELTESLGKGLLWAAGGVIDAFRIFASVAMAATSGVFGVIGGVKELIASFIDLTGGPKAYSAAWRASAQESITFSKEMAGAAEDLADKVTKSGEHRIQVEQKATVAGLSAAKAKVDARMKEMKAYADAAKNAEAYARACEKLEQDIEKTIADRTKYESTFYEWKTAEIEVSLREFKKAGIEEERITQLKTEKLKTLHAEMSQDYKKALEDAILENEKNEGSYYKWKSVEIDRMLEKYKNSNITEAQLIQLKTELMKKEETKATQETLTAYSTMYQGIKTRGLESYNIHLKLIDLQRKTLLQMAKQQAKTAEEVAVATVAAETWAIEQRKTKWIEYAQTTDDVMMGIKAGLMEMQQDMYTWGRAGYDIFKSFAQSSQNVISSVLFDGMKRQLKSFHDYWKSFTDALLKTFVDIVARMVVEWGTAQLYMSQLSFAGGLAGSAGMIAGTSLIPATTGAGAGYYLATAGAGATMASGLGAGAGSMYAVTPEVMMATGTPEMAAWASQYAGTGTLLTWEAMPATGWLSGVSAAAPYLLAAFAADQILFGGKGTKFVGDVIGGVIDVGKSIVDSVGDFFGSIFHEGGVVGQSLVPHRLVPAIAWAGAPRLHQGFAPDEYPAILQRGERVLSRMQNASYEKGMQRDLHIHLELDGREIGYAIIRHDDVVTQIDYKLNKLQSRRY